jgi:hypothetical protein
MGLAEAEGVAPAVDIGALQPQGLGRRRMIVLGQHLAQQRALEGHRGVMIRQGGWAGDARSGGAPDGSVANEAAIKSYNAEHGTAGALGSDLNSEHF